MTIRVFLVGFGNVGRSLAEILLRNPPLHEVEVAGVANSKGSVLVEGPADKAKLAKILSSGERLEKHPSFRPGLAPVEGAVVSGAHVAMVTLPPSYETGEPNRSIYYGLLEEEISIITADKTVLALDYARITGEARRRCLFLGYRATVAAGTPALDSARGLKGRGVEEVRAVLNASTNYILGLVEEGYSYEEAVEKAIQAKLAEPDPRIDLEGYDPAAKLAILASTLGYEASLRDVVRVPLTEISEDEVREALVKGKRVKYVAYADLTQGTLRVEPRVVDSGDPLASAVGEDNVIVFQLESTSIVLKGPAGPAWRTAKVMVTDLIEYAERLEEAGLCGCS